MTLLMRLGEFSHLLISFLLLQQATDSFARRRSHGRKFTRGNGAAISVQPGDTLVSNLIVSAKNKVRVHAPYRWYYAINADHLLFFSYGKRIKHTQPKMISIKSGKFAKVKFINRGKKQPHIGPAGGLVAILMSTKQLPFNLFFCNSKHYVEYLSRGYAKGKWYKLLFNRVSKNCPVQTPIKREMAWQIYSSGKFTLEDRAGNSILLSIPAWPSYLPPPPLP